MSETLLHVPTLALMQSALHNNFPLLASTIKWSEPSLRSRKIRQWLQPEGLVLSVPSSYWSELGRWQDDLASSSESNPNTNLHLLL